MGVEALIHRAIQSLKTGAKAWGDPEV